MIGNRRCYPRDVMPLSMVRPGGTAVLVDIQAGRGLVRHLSAMGLVPGTHVQILSDNLRGPLMVRVRGTKMALARGMAHKILVTLPA
jgi:Fe2+ transport system protein FeoA